MGRVRVVVVALVVGALGAAGCAPTSPDPPSARDPFESAPLPPARAGWEASATVIDARAAAPVRACVDDVPSRFRAIAAEVPPSRYLGAHNAVIPWPRYSDGIENNLGAGEHFQGIARVGNHLIVSGGVMNGPRTSQLVVIEMGGRDPAARFAPAASTGAALAEGDSVVAVVDLDPVLWHAGGIQIADEILVVALETGDPPTGELRFYDVADPTSPRELGPRIARDRKLYAAALARLEDGRLLAISWDDARLELVRSRSADIGDGFEDGSFTIHPDDVVGGFQGGPCGIGCGSYQAINLVPDCAGGLFLVATRNAQQLAPVLPGDEVASLYALTFAADGAPSLALVERRSFHCADRQCNFAAAAGVHVLNAENLLLYAAYHWLQEGGARLRFNEM